MLRSFFSRHAKGIVVASNIAVQAGIQVWIKKNRAEDAPQAPLTDEKADRGKAQPPTFFGSSKRLAPPVQPVKTLSPKMG